MRAAAFTGFGGPENVEVIEQDYPEPGAGEAVLDVKAAALNYHDVFVLEGDSAFVGDDALPFVSGVDVAGVVRDVGENASVEEGDRVVLCAHQTCGECQFCREGPENLCKQFSLYHGGFAEQALVGADRLVDLPESVSFEEAAALPVSYVTAYHMLRRANLEAGDTVFVPGSTGGVGVATVQLAEIMGCETIGTSTSEEKLSRVEDLGLDHGILSGDIDEIREEVNEIGRPDAVINHLGGPFTELGQNVLRRGGTMVICGRTTGNTPDLALDDLFLQHKHVVGSTMGTQVDLERLVGFAANGKLNPIVGDTYALEETGDAFADMLDRDAFGKLVVTP